MTTARDRKNLRILPENSAGESAAWVIYLSMIMHLKSCHLLPKSICNFTLWFKEGRSWSNSNPIVKVSVLTLQALTYIEGNDRTGGPIWNYVTGTLTTLTSWEGCETGSRCPTQLR